MDIHSFEIISDVLKDCASGRFGLCEIDEQLLFEDMTTVEHAILGLPEEDGTKLLTERDFLNMEAVESDVNGNDVYVLPEGDFMWPSHDENCPEEVMLEIEVISTWEDEKNDRTIVDLDNATHSPESDYGSESGTDHTSDMDLSQGSLDLSRTGPYYKSPPIPQPPPLTMRPVQNQSPISPVPNGQQNGCLDLSRSANSTPNTYMHYSGGTSINLSQGITQEQSQYYQLPRIKLEPGLGIDPTITYKPEMDYNHNEHMTSPAIPVPSRTAYDLSYEQNINDRIKNEEEEMNTGCEQVSRDAARDMSSEPRVTVETINANCIPLTVMSQDDENDSGTESIDSKDSDACSNLNINENGTGQKTDRKRPGRKKGQVSKVYHLWEFIRDVLNDPRYCGKVIKWENEEEGIFRVVQSETAASMWGQKKNNRTKMTYEKMSRSIRYSRKEGYFDDLPKDKGYPKKLCFKFGKKAHGWNTTRKPVLTQSNCVPPTV